MGPPFNMIVAVCKNGGIGFQGNLPWRLKNEMAFFKKMTTALPPGSEGKKNVVIMGRKTWDSIPAKFRPLANRVNVVISSTMEASSDDDVFVFRSLSSALSALGMPPYSDIVADLWLIGGSSLYAESLALPECRRLYVTRILREFECDTFFPPIPDRFRPVEGADGVPTGLQEEDGVEYEYQVLEAVKSAPNEAPA